MGEKIEYVVATTAANALEAYKSFREFYIADVARIEHDDHHGGEHRVFAVDEGRTVAVSTTSNGYALDVAIEVPYLSTDIGSKLARHLALEILKAKRGAL